MNECDFLLQMRLLEFTRVHILKLSIIINSILNLPVVAIVFSFHFKVGCLITQILVGILAVKYNIQYTTTVTNQGVL